PPMSGFVGKIGLLSAGAAEATPLAYVLMAGAVVTSLLTLYAMAKVWNRAFWRSPPASDDGRDALMVRRRGFRMPAGMVVTSVVLVLGGLGLTVVAGPLYAFTERAAADSAAVTYIHAVLGEVR
ncbi:MAG: Na+/H+ antiporter subunit D, partial [Propionibacteriales bacterium]|nr:Na+/H+ antiporter subunit D [Propionibacteriales bacterium]